MIGDRFPRPRPPAGFSSTYLEAVSLIALAWDGVSDCAPQEEVMDALQRARDGWEFPSDPTVGGQTLILLTACLTLAEGLDSAVDVATDALTEARNRGFVVGIGSWSTMRGMACYRRGDLLEAEADAAVALELISSVEGAVVMYSVVLACGILSGLERGTAPVELQRR